METQKNYNELFLEFSTLGSEMDELSLFLYKKIEEEGRVTHSPKVQWSGIVGAIQDSKEEKKRIEFLNEPLYKGMSFGKIAFFIMDKTDEIVEKAITLQQFKNKTDIEYYAVGKLAFDYTTSAAAAWHNYAPEAAEKPVIIGDQKDVGLWFSVKSEIIEQLTRLDLPNELKKQLQPESKNIDSNIGCLGLIIILAIITPLLAFVV